MVNAIVLDDNWRWPAAMSIDLAEIRSRMPSYNPNSTLDDRILWLPSSNGIYLASSAMEYLRTPHPLVSWYKIVWFPQNIPRMGFILWLAIKGFALYKSDQRQVIAESEMSSPGLLFVQRVGM
ncbi:hypothetical protein Ddye_025780 [Dipteronia dyeriana]|uniref:Reverse transcriptase zinc-binding domain-containing protein n=1 Tax=Dipteronia dyeriana TaxID=168575 RepID=A0AAD9TKX6_9ROSI|nr:hypothetical protein Ddye_025780 [Dipteronia dyeriana]